jgi:hypothetical protein
MEHAEDAGAPTQSPAAEMSLLFSCAVLEEKVKDADCDEGDCDEHSYDVAKVAKRLVLVIAQDVTSWF